MRVFNFSGLRSRDKKIYSFGGAKISSTGISTNFLKIVTPVAGVFLLLGIIIQTILGKNFFNPFGPDFSMTYVVIFLGGGIGLGCALWYIKLESYRLYEYLLAYFRPKKTMHNLNTRNKEVTLTKYKAKGIVKSDF